MPVVCLFAGRRGIRPTATWCNPPAPGRDRIGEFWGHSKTRTFAELLINCEEDRTLRAVLVGMLREDDERPRR